jgi:hypothetical protein
VALGIRRALVDEVLKFKHFARAPWMPIFVPYDTPYVVVNGRERASRILPTWVLAPFLE